jgi:cytochrome oxidase Cu insertion factor (SCO1/SenC/PrrC family)
MRQLAAAFAFVAVAAAATPDFAGVGFQAYQPAKPAPAFTLVDLDGQRRTLADYRGKVVLLFFWATW